MVRAMEKHIRKIGRIGKDRQSSYYITLPKDIVRDFGWIDGRKLVVRKVRGRRQLLIEDY
jgi:hypothetical protein